MIEELVSKLSTISGNEIVRYMFVPNKVVDLSSLNRAQVMQYNECYAVIKNVSYTKQPFTRMIYPFVSLSKSDLTQAFQYAIDNNVKDVILDSVNLEYYKKSIPNFNPDNLSLAKQFTDFYSDLNTRFVDYNENKFIKQHKIRKFQDRLELRKLTLSDYYAVIDLYNSWAESKHLHNQKSFKHFFKYFPDYLSNPNLFIYGMFYDNQLMTWGVINLHGTNNHIAYEAVQQSYTSSRLPDNFELTDENRQVISNIGQIVYYYLYKYLKSIDVDIVHCAGSYDTRQSLLDYKLNLYKNKIDYYVYKFNK